MKAVAISAALVAALLLWLFLRTDDRDSPVEPTEVSIVAAEQEAVVRRAQSAADSEEGVSNAESNDIDCPDNSGRFLRTNEEQKRLVESATSSLLASGDPEHLLAAALMRRWSDPQAALAQLEKLVALESNSPLSAWTALIICGQRAQLACDFGALEQEAIRADSKNGAMWVQLVGLRLEDSNDEQAIEAMRQAISAPKFDSYYFEQIMMIERALAATSDLSLAERVITGIGFAAATPMGMNALARKCDDEQTGVWLELCDQLGERMRVDGSDIMTQMLGSAVQGHALANRGDSRGLQELELKKTEIRRTMGSAASNAEWFNLMTNDERVLREYLQNMDVFGEAAAMKRLSSEAERLRALSGYDQCNFEGDPFGASVGEP